jgi:hypothetical protein
MLDEPDRQFAAHAVTTAAGLPAPTKAEADLTSAVCDLGGYLTGITLFAAEAGGICDDVLVVAATNPARTATGLTANDRGRGVIQGRLSHSTLQRWSPT